MIKLEPYTSVFEEEYWSAVDKKIPAAIQQKILNSCITFLPTCFWDGEAPNFKKLILAPYAKLKKAKEYIASTTQTQMEAECFIPIGNDEFERNDLYQEMYEAFDKVADSQRKGMSMRVRLVKEADLTVCPYCNRDYINCRADNVSGAQLDHFYSRSDNPIFAVSLYNLIPVCGNCNRVKSNKPDEFASPFDETIDWENEVKFVYESKSLQKIKIDIKSQHAGIQNNIKGMRIEEAYQIHESEILELLEKEQAYSKSQKEEFQKVLHKMKISDEEVKHIIFGPKITREDMRKKPLGKMLSDMHKELKVY